MTHRSPAPARTWPELLKAARTAREVVDIARNFVASWTPQEVKALPQGCDLPLRFQEPEDVILYTFALSQARLAGKENDALSRMWSFFMEASQRAGALMDREKARVAANSVAVDRTED
jgi:hypothetical protein